MANAVHARLTRRTFVRLLGGTLFLSACRTGALPLPTPPPAPISAPPIAATPSASVQATPIATPAPTAIPLATRITPISEFYVQTYRDEPDLNAGDWSLRVDGLVSKPTTFSLADIRALPAATQMRTLECIGNPIGGNQIGNAVWKGALFMALAESVGVKPNAAWVVIRGADDYVTSVPLEALSNPDTLLAYEMGGEALPRGHGFPMRLLAPGVYGQKQPKWITQIEFSKQEVLGTWEELGWSREATIYPNGTIESPAENAKLNGQTVFVIQGVAFAGSAGVASVELSFDKGRTFVPAQMQHGPSNYVWTMWAYAWTLPAPGKYTLAVRVTDKSGDTQKRIGSLLANSFPKGALDMHAMVVEVLG